MVLSIGNIRSAVDEMIRRSGADHALTQRLRDSVTRPLDEVADRLLRAASETGTSDPADPLWSLAIGITALRVANPDVLELAEAGAALQDLALTGEPHVVVARRAELEAMQEGLPGRVQVMRNGPYLITNPACVRNALGEAMPTPPQLALCRCGGSQRKPFCDGAHARLGFTDAKDPNRVPDRRDEYVGQQVGVLDNRGLCQHSGFCTQRLPGVFRAEAQPFVTPSGGRMDEIIRAVRDCPSGALSYAVDGFEARDQVDHHGRRPPEVEVARDGPYRITGSIPLVDHDGADVARNAGASQEHYALCRCGHSQNKPFCSGMHYYVDFHDPMSEPDAVPSIFAWAGGFPMLERMTRLFYEKYVPADDLLSPLFASMSADHPQRVAAWLGEVFGGPNAYSGRYGGYARMLSQHIGKGIDERHRARWVDLLMRSADEAGLPNDPEFRSLFAAYIEWGSRLAVENSQAESQPPEHMPMPHWQWQTAAGPPGSRAPARADAEQPVPEPPVALPADSEPVSFATHIRTLFRERDRSSMLFAFDLWNRDDVAAHATAILARLRAGTMPCDGTWPENHIGVLARWIDEGTIP